MLEMGDGGASSTQEGSGVSQGKPGSVPLFLGKAITRFLKNPSASLKGVSVGKVRRRWRKPGLGSEPLRFLLKSSWEPRPGCCQMWCVALK